MLALPRPIAFAGCSIIAAINARMSTVAASIGELGFQNSVFSLFHINAVIWFSFYAAWTIARSPEAQEPYRQGDGPVLCALIIAILLPFPLLSASAGLAAGIWFLWTSKSASAGWRLAFILTAISAQQVFGRLFLALFSEIILEADLALVEIASGLQAHGNVLTRSNGSELIVAAGCSSVGNMSYAFLAWATAAQLFKLRFDKRLLLHVFGSLVAIFVLNSARLLSMAWFPEHFIFLHEGAGAAIFGWTGFLMLAVLIGIALFNIAPKQRRA
jgi:exosortase/archaeosortase family protein